MTTKTIRWFVGGYVQATPHEGADRFGAGLTYLMERDYFPRAIRMYLDSAPVDQAVILDVQDDGLTIFRDYTTDVDIRYQYPQIDKGVRQNDTDFFTANGEKQIDKDSVLTLEIRQSGQEARNLTVELDLEEIE